MVVHRITLFNIPNPNDLPPLLAEYEKMKATAFKDGSPYILSVRAGATLPDQRSQGYTLAVQTDFASLDDMHYYDTDCAAHKALKAVAAGKREGNVLVAYFEDADGGGA